MKCFCECIEEIENNLTNEIDIDKLARMSNLSVYEFRRLFSYIAGLPINEYIRKRRLSVAVNDVLEDKNTITEIAVKYGYDSPSSFSRAFKEFHGVSPTQAKNENCKFNLITKISAEIITGGGNDISYRIENETEFFVYGISGESNLNDTECCESVWSDFENSKISQISDSDKIFAVYENSGHNVFCHIGVKEKNEDVQIYKVPKSKWVKFDIIGTDDNYVNKFYNDILNGWFNSSGYVRDYTLPNIEVFPFDMSQNDFLWQIWIPIKNNA